jgi:hypothetical protein
MVDEFIAAQSVDAQVRPGELRDVVGAAVPGTVEGIRYGLPTDELDGPAVACGGAAKSRVGGAVVPAVRDADRGAPGPDHGGRPADGDGLED